MIKTIIETTIEELIEAPIEDLGYEIIRIKLIEGDYKILQIMAERKSDGQLNVDDCAIISETISMILDVEDPITHEYNLEVSSPGIDRPLTRIKDFINYKGELAKITLSSGDDDGRRRFKGALQGVTEDEKHILILTQDSPDNKELDFNDIESAKLVLTNKLLKRAGK